MTTQKSVHLFYSQPATMTDLGQHVGAFDGLPRDLSELVAAVQGLILHAYMATAYGVTITEERSDERHFRPLESIVDRILALDARPLSVARPPEARFSGLCNQFSLLLVALLRSKGVPARSRCGFASYFNPGCFEDHWVTEYWDCGEERWIRVDSQLDQTQRDLLKVDFDPFDVPQSRFMTAGEAWTECRAGRADPEKFGFSFGDMRGLWFIAGDLSRDFAALNNHEMLPWDVWGAMPFPDEVLGAEQFVLFDRLATLTANPDTCFEAVRGLYESDDRLRVPPVVFNAVLSRPESV